MNSAMESRTAELSDSATTTKRPERPAESTPPDCDSPGHLLNIAAELRLNIYDEYFTSYNLDFDGAIEDYRDKNPHYYPPLLRVDPRITHEALPVYEQYLTRRISEVDHEFTAYISDSDTNTNDKTEETRKKHPLFAACLKTPNSIINYSIGSAMTEITRRTQAMSRVVQAKRGYAAELIKVQMARSGKAEQYLVDILEYGMHPDPRRRMLEFFTRLHGPGLAPLALNWG